MIGGSNWRKSFCLEASIMEVETRGPRRSATRFRWGAEWSDRVMERTARDTDWCSLQLAMGQSSHLSWSPNPTTKSYCPVSFHLALRTSPWMPMLRIISSWARFVQTSYTFWWGTLFINTFGTSDKTVCCPFHIFRSPGCSFEWRR